jgi:uncharacterized glyoxalase superfamily protein PhnB
MKLVFDHLHCVHTDAEAAADFYKKMFDAKETDRIERGGAVQVYLDVFAASVILRGQRDGEKVAPGTSEWPRFGIDHYAFCVEGKLTEAVEDLEKKGAEIIQQGEVEDLYFAYVKGPDAVVIELVELK